MSGWRPKDAGLRKSGDFDLMKERSMYPNDSRSSRREYSCELQITDPRENVYRGEDVEVCHDVLFAVPNMVLREGIFEQRGAGVVRDHEDVRFIADAEAEQLGTDVLADVVVGVEGLDGLDLLQRAVRA
jgi:hypothetical protein